MHPTSENGPLHDSTTAKVISLLQQATDQKVLQGGNDGILKRLDAAAQLCEEASPPIERPYPQLVAYRRAMVRLRKTSLTTEELLEIDEDLTKATNYTDDFLGPWPRLYRLPVLARLVEREKAHANDLLKAHEFALKAVRKALTMERDLRDQEEASEDYRALIQSHLFNALEMTTFFVGLPYKTLEGLGALFPEETCDLGLGTTVSQWVIVSSEENYSDYTLTKNCALANLEEKKRKLKNSPKPALLFQVGIDGKPQFDPYPPTPDGREFNGSREQAVFLSQLLARPGITREMLKEEYEYNPSTLRTKIETLMQSLSAFFGVPCLPGQPSDELRISPEVFIFGVTARQNVWP